MCSVLRNYKKPRAPSQTLQASVHDSTVREMLNKCGLFLSRTCAGKSNAASEHTFGENTSYHHKHFILAVKHSGVVVMIWFGATEFGHFADTEPTTNSCAYQSIQIRGLLCIETVIAGTPVNRRNQGIAILTLP